MPIPLDEHVTALLNDETAIKALATTGKQGVPHVVVDHTISVDANGNILYLELIETSETNTNLVNSLWFKRKISIHIAKDDARYEIKGIPVRSVISGPLFEHYYKITREWGEDVDLSTVWIIEPEEISNESYAFRRQKEIENHPLIGHLDRLAK